MVCRKGWARPGRVPCSGSGPPTSPYHDPRQLEERGGRLLDLLEVDDRSLTTFAVAEWVRGHGVIEGRLYYIREWAFDEDRGRDHGHPTEPRCQPALLRRLGQYCSGHPDASPDPPNSSWQREKRL